MWFHKILPVELIQRPVEVSGFTISKILLLTTNSQQKHGAENQSVVQRPVKVLQREFFRFNRFFEQNLDFF